MKLKKDKLAFGIFQDGLSIKVAQLGTINGKIRIIRLEDTVLSHPLMGEEISEELEKLEKPEEELKIPEISEYDKPVEIEKIEEAPEDLTGKTDLQNLLLNFPLDKGKIALNANEEQVSYYPFEPGYFTSRIKKKIQEEVLSKEELKAKNYTLDYIYNADKSILAFVHRGESELLKALHEINLIMFGKKFFYSFIDTNEISLMNLQRGNYEIPPEEYVLILYIGIDYKVGIVMEGKSHFKTFPIIVTNTDYKNTREAIYSKIMLEQDVSNIPIPQHILLAGDNVSKKDVTFFQEKYPEASIEILDIKNVTIDDSQAEEFTKEKIGEFAIPIALAWKTLDTKNKALFPSNLLPTKIIENQKHFKIAWHGFLILAAIFYFTVIGTTKNISLKQNIMYAQKLSRNLELETKQKQNIITKINRIRSEISVLENNINEIEDLIGNKNQWHYILNVLANALLKNKISWITNLKSSEDNFQISGYTTKKRNVIRFSKLFPKGRIERVTSHLIENLPIWRYDITFSYPEPKDLEIEEEERLSKIQIAELPEEHEIEVAEVEVKEIYNAITHIYFSGNHEEALEKLNEFIEKYPGYPRSYYANYLTGECLYQMGRIAEAKTIFENTIRLKGTKTPDKTPDALMMLGNCYKKENNLNRAVDYWKQLLTNYPDHKLAIIAQNKINTSADLYNIYKKKLESKTKVTLDEITEKSKKGIEISQTKDISAKQFDKNEVYELQLLSRRDLSQVEQDKKEMELLGYKTKISSILKEGDVSYRLRLSDSYTQAEATALGEKIKEQFSFINNYWIEKTLDDDDISEIYNNIIKIYFSGNYEEALEKLNEFIEKYPGYPRSYYASYFTGECLYQMGRIAEAKTIFENTIRLKGTKTPDALMMLGNCYKNENDLNRAIDYWNQLINTFPDDKLSKVARYKIKISRD